VPHDLDSIWEHVRGALRAGLPSSTFRLWIDPLRPVAVQGSTLYVAAPDATRAWVERRYTTGLAAALRAQGYGLEGIMFVREGVTAGANASGTPPTALVTSLPLDPSHTFERFVIGDGNRLAHAASLAVAELPGEAYNPLFVHGPPGLGKTHLLGAIVDYLRRRRPELTVHYTTAERFTTEFVTALRKDGPERFKQRYRGLDALLIDDVQALEGKEHTQEEFVHTFNALHAAGKQIVLSSDRPPDALARLADRLRDRFQWGLSIELLPPDLRTRTALVWRMAIEEPLEVPEPTVLHQIAHLAAGNVRRLQGAMTRIAALSSVLGKPVTPAFVEDALAAPTSSGSRSDAGAPASPSAAMIQEAVCSVLAVSRRDLLSPKRTTRVTHARHLAIYLTRDLTSLSLAEIAREFNRDHSTVLHAIRAISARLHPGSDISTALHQARELITPATTSSAPPTEPLHDANDSPQPLSTNPLGNSEP
jgi:chromosomal replication initiator protein